MRNTGRRHTLLDYLDIPLFAGLSRVDLARLMPELEEVLLEPGEVLLRQGAPGDAVYIVRVGRLQAETEGAGGAAVLAELGPGESIGEMALLMDQRRMATVRAIERARLWRLSRTGFDTLLLKHPDLARHFVQLLGKRLAETNRQLGEASRALAGLVRPDLNPLSPQAQALAYKTSPLWRFSRELAAELRGEPPDAAMAELTERGELTEAAPGRYQLSSRLRIAAALQGDAREGYPHHRDWSRHLARRCEEGGDYPNAVEAFLTGRAHGEAARVLTNHQEELLEGAGAVQVAAWVERALAVLPETTSLMHLRARAVAPAPSPKGSRHLARRSLQRWVSIPLAALLFYLVWRLAPALSFSETAAKLLAILAGATVLWSFDTIPDYATALVACVVALIWGVAPQGEVFSGFTSSSFFLLLSIFGLSTMVSQSGLAYRVALLGMRWFRPTYRGQAAALAASGLLFTALIPSVSGRFTMAGPLVLALKDSLRFGDRSNGAAGLSMAAYLGFGQLSFLFMHGAPTGLIVYSLLPPDVAATVSWGGWSLAALPLALAVFACGLLATFWLFRPELVPPVDGRLLAAQLRVLGQVGWEERLGLTGLAALLLAFALRPIHGINPAWFALLIIAALFLLGADRNLLATINYRYLLYFGAFISLADMISASGTGEAFAELVRPAVAPLAGSPYLFLGAFCLVSYLLIALLPWLPSEPMLMITSLPVASAFGYHPLIFGLIIVATVLPGLLPSIEACHQTLYLATEERAFTYRQLRRFAWAHLLITLAGVLLSVPFWQWLGLVP